MKFFSTLLLSALYASAFCGLAPENVIVVVNGDSWASLSAANEYRKLRSIPSNCFVVLDGISSNETVSADQFRSQILGPVLKAIQDRGLKNQIDCITYSLDIPYAVDVTNDMKGRAFAQVITPTAAANGVTYLYEPFMRANPSYLDLDINRYFRQRLPLPKGVPLSADESNQYGQALQLYAGQKYTEAASAIAPVLSKPRRDPNIAYNAACIFALAGKSDEAITAFRMSVNAGWRNFGQALSDPDLKSVQERSEFKELIDLIRKARVQMQAPKGFRGGYGWDEEGDPAAMGPHYLLSTFLGVTAGRANSYEEVIDCLRRAAQADFTKPSGTIYYMKNGDVRSTTREWGFAAAVETLNRLGVRAEVQDGILPSNQPSVVGGMIGTADFNWAASGSKIAPGAIVEHLTSFGAVLGERNGQTPCTEFIRAGAAGSSGTVTEPYAVQEKFPDPFIQVRYASGYTLAESYYQSLYGPYQLLIIGEPMCRPWGEKLNFSVPGLAPNKVFKAKFSIQPKAAVPGSMKFEMSIDGIRQAVGTTFSLDTKSFPDGYHVIGITAVKNGDAEAKSTQQFPVIFSAKGQSVKAKITNPGPVIYGEKVELSAECKGAKTIELWSLGRRVGAIQGEKGTAQIDSKLLGFGTADLRAIARLNAGSVAGSPISLNIMPPPPSNAKEPNVKIAPGIRVESGGRVRIEQDTIDPFWLAPCVKAGEKFTVEAYLKVPTQGVYQLQLRSNTNCTVEVSGRSFNSGNGSLQYMPVVLTPGTHRIFVTGTANDSSQLDLRIGKEGCLRLSKEFLDCRD